jgi:hypothetical protein
VAHLWVLADKPLLARHWTGQKVQFGLPWSRRRSEPTSLFSPVARCISWDSGHLKDLMSRVGVWLEPGDTSNVQIPAFATQSTTVRPRGFGRLGDGSQKRRAADCRGEVPSNQIRGKGRIPIDDLKRAVRLMLAPRPFRKRALAAPPAQLSFPGITISHPSEAPLRQAKNNLVRGIVSMVFTAELDLRAKESLEN